MEFFNFHLFSLEILAILCYNIFVEVCAKAGHRQAPTRRDERNLKMLFKNITILDENFEIKENMYVGTEGIRITYIGT